MLHHIIVMMTIKEVHTLFGYPLHCEHHYKILPKCMRVEPVLLILVTMSSIAVAFRQFGGSNRIASLQRHRNGIRPTFKAFSLKPSTKPDFGKEMHEKHFEFNRLERNIYTWWESRDMFKPDHSVKKSIGKKPFVIPMPPPNVTGKLVLC